MKQGKTKLAALCEDRDNTNEACHLQFLCISYFEQHDYMPSNLQTHPYFAGPTDSHFDEIQGDKKQNTSWQK